MTQISKCGILLYTKQTQQTYGSYCIGFRGGTRNESINQQGSLLSLFLMQNINNQQNKQQIKSIVHSLFNHSRLQNFSMTQNDDTESAAEFLSNLAFTKRQMHNNLKSLIGQLNQFKDRVPIQGIVSQTCFSQTEKLILPKDDHFIDFQQTNFTPENCIIAYLGRRTHEQISKIFESLLNTQNECISCLIKVCNRKFQFTQNQKDFTPQTIRIEDEFNSEFEVGLIFNGASLFETGQLAIDIIISEILGNIGIKQLRQLKKIPQERLEQKLDRDVIIIVNGFLYQVLQNNHFLYNAGAITQNYSDCGRFGIYLSGNTLQKQEIYQLALTELKKLSKISDYEIERAKNIAITKYYVKLERQQYLLIEEMKNLILGGKLFEKEELPNIIQQITRMQIEQRIQQLLKSQLCVIYVGKGAKTMPDENMTILRLSYD